MSYLRVPCILLLLLWGGRLLVAQPPVTNEANPDVPEIPSPDRSPEDLSSPGVDRLDLRLFREGDWILSYGLGYGGITPLFYAFGFSRDPYRTSSVVLHTLSVTAAIDYFFGDYFDIGVDFTMGGNLNGSIPQGEGQLYGGDTRFFLLLTGLRGFVHYPFQVVDLYGGLTLGLGLTRQTFTYDEGSGDKTLYNNRVVLGWILRLGARFRITDHHGMFAEMGFPHPWITLGGYYRLK